jgi:hypothetical protein
VLRAEWSRMQHECAKILQWSWYKPRSFTTNAMSEIGVPSL